MPRLPRFTTYVAAPPDFLFDMEKKRMWYVGRGGTRKTYENSFAFLRDMVAGGGVVSDEVYLNAAWPYAGGPAVWHLHENIVEILPEKSTPFQLPRPSLYITIEPNTWPDYYSVGGNIL